MITPKMFQSRISLFLKLVKKFIAQHRWEVYLLISVIVVGACFRFYRIDEYLTFLGDEGRDARVVSNMITNLDPVLIGPMTSVTTSSGHMYLGPAYYYLMMPFMAVSNLSPVGPAVMVAFFSLATVYLLWWVGRTWFHPTAGVVAALLYAISPTVIIYSRSSWNPNIMPFFSLLAVWSMYQLLQKRGYYWLLIASVCTAVILQSHYLGLLLLPLLGLLWAWQAWKEWKNIFQSKKQSVFSTLYFRWSAIALGVLILLMSPLVIFDLRHNWLNFNAFKAFFTERQTTVNLKFYKGFEQIYPLLKVVTIRMLSPEQPVIALVTLIFIAIGIIIKAIKAKTQAISHGLAILVLWLCFGLLGLSIYKQHIYDHYFGFLYPVPFLLTGWLFWQFWKANLPGSVFNCCFPISKIFGGLVLTGLIISNLSATPLQYPPNRQMYHTKEVAELINQQSASQPFNLAMIAKSNYDEGYRFYLERMNAPLVTIDPQNPETITDQLFVICEDSECNPIGHEKSEIANFGWATIEQQWKLPWGHTLYKLKHFQPETQPQAEVESD